MQTPVFGFALPIGHEALEDVGDATGDPLDERCLDEGGTSRWIPRESPEVVCYATFIGDGPLARMAALTQRYRKDRSATTGTRYFMNHCQHCDAKLGDFDTIEEVDAPLSPLDAPAPDRLQMIPVSEHFEAEANTTPLPFASSIEGCRPRREENGGASGTSVTDKESRRGPKFSWRWLTRRFFA